jgi:serine/threonine-protein kinase
MSNTDSSPTASEAKRVREKVPKQIGKYRLVRRLGAGGMGAVFLAEDERTKRNVALKVLPRERAANETLVKRFRSEAQAAANLEHENIVRVYEADEADGYLYIALEYVDGTDVNCILRKRERMPVRRSIEIVRQVAEALQHAHQQGIVHRDIKPSNLMIRKDGVLKLTDLGLARSIDESTDTNITRAGTTVGTVDYMAPEQARNSRLADIRSDLYSLGCTWYQMLVGHPPYHEGSMTNKLQAHATAPPPDPRDENPDVPESIVIILQRLMAKKPEDRYQTPQELLDDLKNSRLHRQAPSDRVFSALATSDDSRTDVPSSETEADSTGSGKSLRSPRKYRSGEQPLIPPRDDSRGSRQPSAQETDHSNASELMKYVIITGVVIGVFIGIWYIVSSLASGLDPGNTPGIGESQRHIARRMMDNQAGPAPTVSARRNPSVPTPVRQRDDDSVNTGKIQQAKLTSPERPTPSQEVSKTSLLNPELDLTVPQWAQSIPMADEVERLFGDWKPKVVTVGRWKNRNGSHSSLNAALAEGKGENLWVRLIGPGPFVLNPIRLEGRNLILSTDVLNVEPIILCVASSQEPPPAFLTIENGSLLLAGINFVTSAHQFPPNSTASLISLTRGNFLARDVTMTLYGKRAAPTTAVTLGGDVDGESARVLLDRSLVRGAWTSVKTTQSRFSMLVTNSLLLAKGVPAIAVAGSPAISDSGQSRPGPKSRWVRLLQSTVVSSEAIISVAPGQSPSAPIPLAIEAEYAILAAAGENPSAMLALGTWPIVDGHADQLVWTQNQALIAGWKSLISSSDAALGPISDVEAWNSFWNRITSLADFRAEPLPLPQSIDSTNFNPELWQWKGNTLPASNLAGAPRGSIRLPNLDQQTTASGLSRFDRSLPASITKSPSETIALDLDRTNLQQRLSRKDWKSGTRFLLSGTKPNRMLPVVVEGRSLILEMAAGQSDSFRLEPRGSQSEPLITVRNGSLRLNNIRLRIPNRTRDSAPQWAVSVTNGSLIIEDSILEGPYIPNKNHVGMVHWSSGSDGRSLRAGSPHRHMCGLRSSYLTTFGTTLSLQPQQGIVKLRDTTLAAEGTAVSMNFESGQGAATLDFRNSTFAASSSIFSVTGSPNTQPPGPSANCIIQECVFAAPLPGAPKQLQPTLLEASSEWADHSHLLWWEKANAYSTEISCFIRSADGSSVQKSLDDWKSIWGIANVQKPLNSPDGVVLKGDYPARASIPPEFFQLDEKSRALSWAPDGSAIGAKPADYVFWITNEGEKKEKKKTGSTSAF